MPKKHQPSYASIKPTAAPQTPRPSTATPTASTPQTVNERIQQLRREQTPRATPDRRDEITEVVTARTIPPQLRRILNMVEVDAPKPKPGTRPRPALQPGQRPPPGPAAPSSWLLSSSRHAPAHVRNLKRKYDRQGPSRFCKLTRVHDEEFKRLPSSGSLVHQCLRTFVMHWEELAEYEQHYLPSLPIPLKEALLSYLSLYGNKGCLNFKTFKILFQNDKEIEDATGSDEVRFLDLTGLLNQEYTLKDLEKSLQRSAPNATVTSAMTDLSLSTAKRKEQAVVEIAESWEDEADDPGMPVLPATLSIPLFPNLTRLSLAHPGPIASWTDLLAISPSLKTLTHLSLAYWPRPSTTPNAATTSMVSRHATVSLGGSHFYSDLDDDWHEAANILRRLSLSTYCLRWLDLEGCSWHAALTWDFPAFPSNHLPTSGADEWVRPSRSPGPDWNGAWRQIEYVNLFQGWLPRDRQTLQNLPAGVWPARVLMWLRDNGSRREVKDVLRAEPSACVWMEREKVSRDVGSQIKTRRMATEGKWIFVDHGWGD